MVLAGNFDPPKFYTTGVPNQPPYFELHAIAKEFAVVAEAAKTPQMQMLALP